MPQQSNFNLYFHPGSDENRNPSQNIAKQELENTLGRLIVERYSSDTTDRQWLAVWTALTVSVWLITVLAIVMQNSSKFFLSDMVLTVLLGTTTLNVLGLSFIVLRGHFLFHKGLEKE